MSTVQNGGVVADWCVSLCVCVCVFFSLVAVAVAVVLIADLAPSDQSCVFLKQSPASAVS